MAFRFFLSVSYNGIYFHGSQIQGEQQTVQYCLNKAISTILRTQIETYGASRTDEGVHALGNMYHFDVEMPLPPNFAYKLNAILPAHLSVNALYTSIKEMEANARFDATSRTYRYRIYHRKSPFLYERALFFPLKFDRQILNETAAILMEYTNFETFSKKNTQSYTFNCQIFDSHWEDHEGELHYIVTANRFLRGMVRALVGTQLKVARGKHSLLEFRKIIEAKDCNNADFSVPGHGLYLESVNYPEGYLTLSQI